MAKKQNHIHPKELEERKRLNLKEETKKSIVSVVLFSLALILILGLLGLAGRFGQWFSKILYFLFGWGYYFLPLLLILAGLNFLRKEEGRIYLNTFLGAALIFLSVLSLLEINKTDEGGLIGKLGWLIKWIFGFWGAWVVLMAVLIIGLLMMINRPLAFPRFKKKEKPTIVEPVINEGVKEAKESISAPVLERKEEKIKEELSKTPLIKPFKFKEGKLPPLDIFQTESSRPSAGDIRANANIIKRTLENFGIEVEMGEINVGPTVTQYTLKPAEGVKLSSIVALQNDLALALASHPLRIEAPIPGKSLVGIEVPNRSIALVRLGSLLKDERYQKIETPLVMALGRDVSGEPYYASLSFMPHLLIAGATGSGKSVCIHSILSSFLVRHSPESLRLILIDPKRIELSIYNGLPHLLTPVICDLKKVLPALKWAISEMERRYDDLLKYNVRDINGYNQLAQKNKEDILPYIVIVIDELADLMAQYGREVEGAIIRLAQMARATGIHLIVSTQRPSVEVITGLIKANITSRIAFAVASQVDSRTILDMAGAERLLGHGDMLYLSAESSKPRRLQGAYVSEEEVKRLVDFWSSQKSETNGLSQDLEVALEKENGQQFIDLEALSQEEEDPLYDEAYEVVVKSGKASASLLQRRLRIGYARAARLLDILESKGVIGPADGAKPRPVYVKEEKTNPENG